jgi:hypothetical protein
MGFWDLWVLHLWALGYHFYSYVGSWFKRWLGGTRRPATAWPPRRLRRAPRRRLSSCYKQLLQNNKQPNQWKQGKMNIIFWCWHLRESRGGGSRRGPTSEGRQGRGAAGQPRAQRAAAASRRGAAASGEQLWHAASRARAGRSSRVQGARREEEPHAQEERGENSRAHRNSRQPRANLQAGAKIQRQKKP